MINKKQVIDHFGSATNVAKALGITPGAVCNWNDDIPPLQLMRLRYQVAPELFDDDPEVNEKRGRAA